MDGYNYNYSYSTTDPAEVGAMLGVVAVIWIIILAISLVIIIAQWKMFKKGNKPGWAAIVPIYNQVVQCQMVGVSPWWILISMIPMVGSIAAIYFMILLSVSTARAFGKSDSFAVGLIFLPIVFYPMLGFGSAQYVGMNPMNDILFKNNNQNMNMNQNMNQNMNMNQNANPMPNQNAGMKACPNCGAQLPADNKFCTSCGTQLQ